MPRSLTAQNDPNKLLKEFVQGDHREEAFLQLVEYFSPLIHSSALRRTRNPQLAEDITQIVLSLLARKASALIRHPSLSGWVFQTTRLESIYAMRSEARRSAKHQRFSKDPSTSHEMNPPIWDDARPHLDHALDQLPEREREVLLLHFFENKKHREIAAINKTSVSASKMQLKRGLERLSSLLRKQGVSLPTTTLTAGLGVQFIATSPAKASSLLAVSALKNAPTLGISALLTNTILTMTSLKKSLLAACLIFVTASIPAAYQAETTSQLKKSLMDQDSSSSKIPTQARSTSLHQKRSTVKDLLNAQSAHFHLDSFLQDVSQASSTYDMIKMSRTFLPIARMNVEELSELTTQIENSHENPRGKMIALQIIHQLSASYSHLNPALVIDGMLAGDTTSHHFNKAFSDWVQTDPDAVLQWFSEKKKTGELLGKGAKTNQEGPLFKLILDTLALTDPARAVSLYHQEKDPNLRREVASLASTIAKAQDPKLFRKLMTEERDPSVRNLLATHGFPNLVRLTKDPDAAMTLLQHGDPHPEKHKIITSIGLFGHDDFQSRFQWLQDQLSENHFNTALVKIIRLESAQTNTSSLNQAITWANNAPAGALHDEAHASLSSVLTEKKDYQSALRHIQKIDNPEKSAQALKWLGKLWTKDAPDEAANALPSSWNQ